MFLRILLVMCCWFASSVQAEPTISYTRDIQPIFNANCISCHACYDAPCQLNLGSGEGAMRGANSLPVYNGSRTTAQDTTRIYIDAHDPQAWRRKGFYSVLEQQGSQAALMSRMLKLGHSQTYAPNQKLPADLDIGINRENQCARPDNFDQFAAKHPQVGMPFAVTGMRPDDYKMVQEWLAEGAIIDQVPVQATPKEQAQVEIWERFFNAPGARESLVSRWLYEHLFIAHLYFSENEETPGHFFQVVRSRTPSGQPVDIIATRRPNEDPGTNFYYRLTPVQGAIVHKTHITYALNEAKLERIKQLFYGTNWVAERVPGYGILRRANPFDTFAEIPAEARYQFMLDDAEYFVRTFIRGPVCRGQIATDVIRDNFWVFFQDPKRDVFITDPEYRHQVEPLLALPGQLDGIVDMVSVWHTYRDKRNEYGELRFERYADEPAPSWSHIWAGNDNALLSVFRQHDSASVRKGLIGEIPQTMWWMDYPLFERTYYQLVVNFDVFGNVSHQAQTRLYFDLIRNGAEINFLRLMPPKSRQAYLEDWYQGTGRLKAWMDYKDVNISAPTGLNLPEKNPKEAFAQTLLERYGSLNARPDPINRCQDAYCYRRSLPAELQDAEQALSRLASKPAATLKVIDKLPEATMLRVEMENGFRVIYSMLRNRAHSNVAFMMGEEGRYQPWLDTLTIYPGVLSSYPNFIFNVPAAQVPEFVMAMEMARDQAAFDKVVDRWGIRRTHPQFWLYFHDLSAYLEQTDPIEAGILDMNRYENL